MLPTKTHINIKTDQVTMKREERYIWKHHKKAGVAILISDKAHFGTNKITRDKEPRVANIFTFSGSMVCHSYSTPPL